ncbi:GATA type transcriptional activator of nitrogen-regulated proteins [Conglomerata obtusa]
MEENMNVEQETILHDLKVSELNKHPEIAQRQSNLYKRLWKMYSLYNRHVLHKEVYEYLIHDATQFSYLRDYERLRYVTEDKKNNKVLQNKWKNEKDILRDDVYNNCILQKNEKNLKFEYGPVSKSNVHGEFGMIVSGKNKIRGRPSNTFRKMSKEIYADPEIENYQPLSYENNTQASLMYDKNNDVYSGYDTNKLNYYQKLHKPEYSGTPIYYDKNNYSYNDFGYYPGPEEAETEFKKTYAGWSNLYKSMTSTINQADQYPNIYERNENVYGSSHFQNYVSEPVCMHCNAKETSLWRRLEGKTVCNACGLYYKMHGVRRPISLKKSTIKKRKRISKRRSLGQ